MYSDAIVQELRTQREAHALLFNDDPIKILADIKSLDSASILPNRSYISFAPKYFEAQK